LVRGFWCDDTYLSNEKDLWISLESNHNIVTSRHKLEAYGTGNVVVSTGNGRKSISNVIYVSDKLSVTKMIKDQHVVVFNSELPSLLC